MVQKKNSYSMDIAQIYTLYKEHPVVTTDSRTCPAGSIFFALKGASFNGNQYAASALEKGCSYAVVDEAEYVVSEKCILVSDVLETLQQLAACHRKSWGGPVLQITGTNGKTTTKELVSAVLAKAHNALYTQGNLNNHIGVPLTLLRLNSDHDMAVVETGANHPGEIAFLSGLVKADCGLISNVGRAHLEGFGSFDGVKKTKGELYDDLKARSGYIFLNAMDDDLRAMAEERGFVLGENALPYVEGRVEACNPFLCVQWREDDWSPWHSIRTHLVGAYNIANIRAAITVGLKFGVAPELIDDAIASYVPTNNRSEFRDTGSNRLIVDAYNANPTSMSAALDNFGMIEAPSKMVVLGEMRELGVESVAEHAKIVQKLNTMQLDKVWLVGEEFKNAVDQEPCRNVTVFSSVESVKEALLSAKPEGYTILVKGSNGTKLFLLPELL